MAATGKHHRGLGIMVDLARVGTLDQFKDRVRPPKAGPRIIRTTWECLNCGNGLVSKRGISRCPRCGSLEVVKMTEPVAQYQAPVKYKETLDDFDPEPTVDD